MTGRASCIDYTDTGSLKRLYWLSISQGTNGSTANHRCETKVDFETGVARASQLITRIHLEVAHKPKCRCLPTTLKNTRSMDHRQIGHWRSKSIQILDPVDNETAFSNSGRCYQGLWWHDRSYGWCHGSSNKAVDSMDGRIILGHEVCSTEAAQILCWSSSNKEYDYHFSTHRWFFPEVAIIWEVWPANGYDSGGQVFLYYPVPWGVAKVSGEWILCQTWRCAWL